MHTAKSGPLGLVKTFVHKLIAYLISVFKVNEKLELFHKW